MMETPQVDPSRMRSDPDRVQVIALSRVKKQLRFPLTRGPIRLSMLGPAGSVSSRWGVKTSTQGDAYVYCRDASGTGRPLPKVSLHASGRNHISITPGTQTVPDADHRFADAWTRPEIEDETIASFSLLFPPYRHMHPPHNMGAKDELLLLGSSKRIVVVGLYVTDSAVDVSHSMPTFRLGKLPLPPSEVLHVVAWKEEADADLLDQIRGAMAAMTAAQLRVDVGCHMICLHGYRGPNSAYMMPVPILHIHER